MRFLRACVYRCIMRARRSEEAACSAVCGPSIEAIECGVRVNVVAPGPVWTPLIPSTMPPESVEAFGCSAPIGRAAQPAELAPTYVFLACEDSSYITGEIVGVGGGRFFG